MLQDLPTYAIENSAHECGHMIVLFKAIRLDGLYFLPHEMALDGTQGVLETNATSELRSDDCAALAGGAARELVYFGNFNLVRCAHDRQTLRQYTEKDLEHFVPIAETIIRENLRFFSLLTVEVRDRIISCFTLVECIDYSDLDSTIPIITSSEVGEIYKASSSISDRT
jgi:hypothetical protein